MPWTANTYLFQDTRSKKLIGLCYMPTRKFKTSVKWTYMFNNIKPIADYVAIFLNIKLLSSIIFEVKFLTSMIHILAAVSTSFELTLIICPIVYSRQVERNRNLTKEKKS